jgi:subtilisin family serine protease
MGCRLDDFHIDAVYKSEELNRDSFNFINLGGRKVAHSQGAFGQGYIAAVLDTGVSPHKEFGDRILPGKNCILGYPNTSYYDDNCHGTHVAGTILGTNCGSAIQSKVLPVKVLKGDGSGEWSDVVRGLDYVKACKDRGMNIKVINMSMSGGESDITDTEDYNLHEAIKRCVNAGIAVCVSAGNTGA